MDNTSFSKFNEELKFSLPFIGRIRSVKYATNAKDILGWNPRPVEDSILEVAKQIQDLNGAK
jgi:dihydroflavonol-4-reductase